MNVLGRWMWPLFKRQCTVLQGRQDITNTGKDGAVGHRQITQVKMGPAADQGLIKGDVLRGKRRAS